MPDLIELARDDALLAALMAQGSTSAAYLPTFINATGSTQPIPVLNGPALQDALAKVQGNSEKNNPRRDGDDDGYGGGDGDSDGVPSSNSDSRSIDGGVSSLKSVTSTSPTSDLVPDGELNGIGSRASHSIGSISPVLSQFPRITGSHTRSREVLRDPLDVGGVFARAQAAGLQRRDLSLLGL
jgi:hypothetical protein